MTWILIHPDSNTLSVPTQLDAHVTVAVNWSHIPAPVLQQALGIVWHHPPNHTYLPHEVDELSQWLTRHPNVALITTQHVSSKTIQGPLSSLLPPADDIWNDEQLTLALQFSWNDWENLVATASHRAQHRYATAQLQAKHYHHLWSELKNQWQQMQDETARRNHAVETDLYMARQLQQSLLPTPLPDPTTPPDDLAFCFSKVPFTSPNLTLRGLYIPSDALGGDLYDVIAYPDGSVGFLVADVSGHGIKAGFITAILKALYQQTARENPDPATILSLLNNQLAKIINTGDYITAVSMLAHPQPDGTVALTYSSAGHPYPMHVTKQTSPTSTLQRLDSGSAPLVWFPDMPYDNGQYTLQPGDGVLVFTDGITELRNAADELYGEERLEDTLRMLYDANANPLPDYLLQEMSDFSDGVALGDDVSLMWLTVNRATTSS